MSDLENMLIAENEQMRLQLRAYEAELKTMHGSGGAGPTGAKPNTVPGRQGPASPGASAGHREVRAPPEPVRLTKERQRELVRRIQDQVWARYEEGKKRVVDVGQPPTAVVAWVVFQRETRELLGEGRGQQAYAAWRDSQVRQPFSECLVVQRDALEAAEERVRAKRGNGVGK